MLILASEVLPACPHVTVLEHLKIKFDTNWCRGKENVDLYIHSPLRLHGVVLNELSTGTTLPHQSGFLLKIYWNIRVLLKSQKFRALYMKTHLRLWVRHKGNSPMTR
jgi:hypothetical protein